MMSFPPNPFRRFFFVYFQISCLQVLGPGSLEAGRGNGRRLEAFDQAACWLVLVWVASGSAFCSAAALAPAS